MIPTLYRINSNVIQIYESRFFFNFKDAKDKCTYVHIIFEIEANIDSTIINKLLAV